MMQVMETPLLDRQKRSLSYNDLKRKRLMRSARSQKHLGADSTGKKAAEAKRGMSEAKTILSSLPRDERVIQGCIEELKGVLGSLQSRSRKRTISIRDTLTDRPSARQSVQEERPAAVWSGLEQAGGTKQLIKHLLSKNRSQRKLIQFNEIRDKFKKEKERSLSTEKQTVAKPVSPAKAVLLRASPKHIPSPVKAIPSPVKAIPSPAKDLKDKTVPNVKKSAAAHQLTDSTQALVRVQCSQLDDQLDRLQKCSSEEVGRLWAQQLGEKENEETPIIADISCIRGRDGSRFNESELKLLQTAQSTSQPVAGSFLRLLNGNESGVRLLRGKELRRRGQLQRVKRIFPSGFFDN